MSQEEVIKGFKEFIAHRVPDATLIEIKNVRPIFGGASRETYAMELEITRKTSKILRKIILRREFNQGIIETQTRTEWEAYRAFADTPVPVPELIWLEEDPRWLGTPFFVMEEVVDCISAYWLLSEPPFDTVRDQIGRQFCNIMGTIAKTEPKDVGLETKLEIPAPDECWKRELDFWEADLNNKELEPHPVIRAAIRWLRKHPPPPAQRVAVVHGDMRSGNFLFNEKGDIKAMLDWEMMHAGDPLEDLTYALNRLWSWEEPDYMGRLMPREQAIQYWEEFSGLKADPKPSSGGKSSPVSKEWPFGSASIM